jgi:hypothetical protein
MTSRHSLSATVAPWLIVSCLTLLILPACSGEAKQIADSSSAQAAATLPKDVKHFSPADFALLRWIEGDWRGQIASGGYFYERYRFADDSTIAMRGFEDSTFKRPNDSATIVFRGGVVTDRGPKARWSATRLDAKGIDFAPVQGATNRFSWNLESADKWTAAILPARGNPTVYQMERVRPK